MKRILLLSLTLPAILASAAAAQTCIGMPSFASGHMQVAGGGSFTDGANSFGATAGYGVPAGLYGKLGLGTTSYDGLDGSSFDLGLSGGYQATMGQSHEYAVCPVASFSYGSGPKDIGGTGVDMSNRSFGFGVSAGKVLGRDPHLQYVPNVGIGFAYSKTRLEDSAGNSVDGSDSYGLATLGVGFVFNSTVSVNPSLSFPVGLEGADPVFGLSAAINFGSR
jgi:hypothetical protein